MQVLRIKLYIILYIVWSAFMRFQACLPRDNRRNLVFRVNFSKGKVVDVERR